MLKILLNWRLVLLIIANKMSDYTGHVSDVHGWENILWVFREEDQIIFKGKLIRLESSLPFNEKC